MIDGGVISKRAMDYAEELVDTFVTQKDPAPSQSILSMGVNAVGWTFYLQKIHSLKEELMLSDHNSYQ